MEECCSSVVIYSTSIIPVTSTEKSPASSTMENSFTTLVPQTADAMEDSTPSEPEISTSNPDKSTIVVSSSLSQNTSKSVFTTIEASNSTEKQC